MNSTGSNAPEDAIAIVGISCRLPGAKDLAQFWRNLCDGVESITQLTEEDLGAAGIAPALARDASYVKACGALDDIDKFDAGLFGLNPRESEIMDPQHRLFLECAWESLESAGYDADRYDGSIGVFGGAGVDSYAMVNLLSQGNLAQFVGPLQASIRNRTDHLTTHAAYKLNLKGPAVTVQTACSTSLVAVHLACQSLLDGQCDMALAGGVTIQVPQRAGYPFEPGGILSPDGHCRPFDADAQGTVPGSGVGIVVLKRLEDAQADGDEIYAVVRGSAINNDGSLKVGYTAPGMEGQAAVIAEALAVAAVSPESIGYVETHGTGTNLGDPIEVAALSQVFQAYTAKRGYCALGAVKSNLGHLDTAAGVAGLIKTALALKHKQIPPTLHYQKPNPHIDFASTPFFVNAELTPWKSSGSPRRAGVSSFGIGGTNAHVVLEEAPVARPSGPGRPWQLLVLSAKTRSALETATSRLADCLKEQPDLNLADVAFTLQVGRKELGHRRAVVCREANAVAALETLDPKWVYTAAQEPKQRPVVFMFPGQGAQYVDMGRELYQAEPTFRKHVDLCCELLRPHLGFDLREVLYPGDGQAESAAERLKQTSVTQPALFVIEYALARLWMEWGVRPEAMIGHSIGEYVAACLADVLSLEDALMLVAARGRLMQALPGGAMLIVPLPAQEVTPLLGEDLSLAAVNGPALCVVSGAHEAIERVERQLVARDVACRRLHTSHAFHSYMMDPILDAFADEVARVKLSPPQIPYVSNVTGTWIEGHQATDPAYWARHLRGTVRFADGVSELVRKPDWILLEVGPGRTLMTIARWHPRRAPGQVVLTSMRHAGDGGDDASDVATLLAAVGRLWLTGARIAWPDFCAHQQRRRVPLPGYPFERQRYWIDASPQGPRSSHPRSLGKRTNLADWFYAPSWKRSVPPRRDPAAFAEEKPSWLLLADQTGLAERLAERLSQMGHQVWTATPGTFEQSGPNAYCLDPRRPEDYVALLEHLPEGAPNRIVHLWNASEEADPEKALDLGFYSLLLLAQAIGERRGSDPLHLAVVSHCLQEVFGGEVVCPEKATILGPCRAIAQEYPNVGCRLIDVDHPKRWAEADRIDALLAELTGADPRDAVVAYRGRHRWIRSFEPVPLESPNGHSPRLRENGVYLITGGLGGMGLELAAHLAQSVHARLILTGRAPLPPREEWEAWLATRSDDDRTGHKIRKLKALEQLGAEVIVENADVADRAAMQSVIDRARQRFGALDGVIHAAGIAGGGMMQRKTRAMAEDVLAAKVRGTRVLEEALDGIPLDFFALCSSRSAILGGFGQVDYAAANAFLDTFAHYHAARTGRHCVSINWAGWQQVGMRVDTRAKLAGEPQATVSTVREIGHPLLARCIEETPEREVYSTRFSVATHWVLDDHRIARQPIIPGTTYLEMIRAALEPHAAGRGIELRDVYFLSALPVGEDETREVRALLQRNGDGFEFRVLSQADPSGGAWREFVLGKARFFDDAPPRRHSVEDLIRRCRQREIVIADDNPIVTYEDLGPRWLSIKKVHLGDNELVALLELPEEFAADVETYRLHPALVDRANFTAKAFLAFEGLHLPLGYKGLRIHRPLPRRLYAYARYKPDGDPNLETITFDVILMDQDGVELVVIDEFSQKRVREVTETIKAAAGQQASALPGDRNGRAGPAAGKEPDRDQEPDDAAMTPEEGVEAFRRLLAGHAGCQIVVSPADLAASIEQAETAWQRRLTEEVASDVLRPKHARPEMATDYAAPRSDLEAKIAAIWQETLGIEQVGVDDNFFDLGGDSVVGIQMIAKFKQAGLDLSPQQLFQNQTIAELAAVLDAAAPVENDQGPVVGPAPLAPSQRRFLARELPEPHHYNQTMRIEVTRPLDPATVRRAVERLFEHHDALRLRFEHDGAHWRQRIAEPDPSGVFAAYDLSELADAEQDAELEARAGELQASLDLARGPIGRFAYFDLGPGRPAALLAVVHYLAIDSMSWWILLADLDLAIRQLGEGSEIRLAPKTTSFRRWAEQVAEYAQSEAMDAERRFWLAGDFDRAVPLPVDARGGANLEATAHTVSVGLEVDETAALLRDVPSAYRASVNDVLLAALVEACAGWTSERLLLVDLEDHGREALFADVDLSRTVGSFRSVYPVLLDLEDLRDPGECLKAVKEQLRRVPRSGIGYGLLQATTTDPKIIERLRLDACADVSFRYLGQIDHVLPEGSPLLPSCRSVGAARSPRGKRSHLLEVEGRVHRGRLEVDWTYSEDVHRRATIVRLAERFAEATRRIVAHCQNAEAGGYTPSDFPLAGIGQRQLDRIAAKFKSIAHV